jgi:hypothetical protein
MNVLLLFGILVLVLYWNCHCCTLIMEGLFTFTLICFHTLLTALPHTITQPVPQCYPSTLEASTEPNHQTKWIWGKFLNLFNVPLATMNTTQLGGHTLEFEISLLPILHYFFKIWEILSAVYISLQSVCLVHSTNYMFSDNWFSLVCVFQKEIGAF